MSNVTHLSEPIFDTPLTLREAFLVLQNFIEQYNTRGPQGTDLMQADLLLLQDGTTSDPAQLDDFLTSAKSVVIALHDT
jgi:hypothetical protein